MSTENIPADADVDRRHVMIDLETLGICHTAAIFAIGAVKFDPYDTEAPMERFVVGVDPQSCQDAKLIIEGRTVMWWLHPDRAAARTAVLGLPYVDLWSALSGFAEWFGEPKPVWGNGANFDNVVLRNAYNAAGIAPPWFFYNDRCYRTLKNMYSGIKAEMPKIDFTELTPHSPLDDAVAQAKHLQQIVKALSVKVD